MKLSTSSAIRTPSADAWPIGLLGVPFDHVTKAQAVDRIEEMIATRRPHYVVTANVDFLVQARRDVELRRILIEADLVLCDGTPLLWASRWLGNALPERAAGADVVPMLIRAAAEHGHRVFLLGAAPDVAAEAAVRLRRKYPGLIVCGHYSPPFRDLLSMEFDEIARRVSAARPDILLVSFGCPKQEKWIAMHHRRLGVPVLIGVGATLDFIAGRVKRAPLIMQRTGTECVFRMAQEPRRLMRRYANDLFRFVPAIARQYWELRPPARAAGAARTIAVERAGGGQPVRLEGDFSAATLAGDDRLGDVLRPAGDDCRLDLSRIRFMDSTGAAVLVQWRRRLHAAGGSLTLINPSAAVLDTLRLMRLTGYFRITAPAAEVADDIDADQPVIPPYPGGHTLGWQGEVTAANAETVWGLTRRHLSEVGSPPRRTFIIDLSRLRFIDSAGAELMGRLHAWARQLENDLCFLGSRREVRDVLRLSKLDHLLKTTRS